MRRGGYVLREARGGRPPLILMATGSELQLAFAAAEALEDDGIPTRVVSLPCWERFDAQDQAYRDEVLPPSVRKRVSVEVGVSLGWERWVGDEGAIIGLDHFGASAPAGTIFEHFGFTADRVADVGRRVVREGLQGSHRHARRRPFRAHGRQLPSDGEARGIGGRSLHNIRGIQPDGREYGILLLGHCSRPIDSMLHP